MTGAAALAAQAAETSASTGEQVVFWIVAPLAVIGALGLVLTRKAVHGALMLAVTMICLAILYIAQGAPFLGIVQVVVYTGAVMMLFLFVLMLVGVDASDSLIETIRGQRVAGVVAGIGLGVLLVASVGRAATATPTGFDQAAPDGNVAGVADLIFTRYVWAFEVTSALLITAALGAMVLAHRERTEKRPSQRELSERRFRTEDGDLSGAAPLPSPGVYARHNAVDTPALLPDGSPSELSISRVLTARGGVRPTASAAGDVERMGRRTEQLESGAGDGEEQP